MEAGSLLQLPEQLCLQNDNEPGAQQEILQEGAGNQGVYLPFENEGNKQRPR